MGKRIAIVEPNNYHGEVLPTMAYLLGKAGFEITVFITHLMQFMNPFVHLPKQHIQIKEISENLAANLEAFDLVVWNSIEPARHLELIKSVNQPCLAVVHRGNQILSSEYLQFFEVTHRKALTLSRHFSLFLKKHGLENTYIFPGYFHDNGIQNRRTDPVPVFCVPGKVEFKRRNYGSVFSAAEKLNRQQPGKDFIVKLLGKNNSIEGGLLRLRKLLSSARNHFEIPGKEPVYNEFYNHLLESDFICPLIDRSNSRFHTYFLNTSSSSIPVGIGHNLIPILYKEFAELYGLDEIAITYKDDGLADAMKTAMALSDDQREIVREKITIYLEQELGKSFENLRSVVKQIM